MSRKRHKPEEIVSKLRQVDVLVSQGQTVADAIRSIGITEVIPMGSSDPMVLVQSRQGALISELAERQALVFLRQHEGHGAAGDGGVRRIQRMRGARRVVVVDLEEHRLASTYT